MKVFDNGEFTYVVKEYIHNKVANAVAVIFLIACFALVPFCFIVGAFFPESNILIYVPYVFLFLIVGFIAIMIINTAQEQKFFKKANLPWADFFATPAERIASGEITLLNAEELATAVLSARDYERQLLSERPATRNHLMDMQEYPANITEATVLNVKENAKKGKKLVLLAFYGYKYRGALFCIEVASEVQVNTGERMLLLDRCTYQKYKTYSHHKGHTRSHVHTTWDCEVLVLSVNSLRAHNFDMSYLTQLNKTAVEANINASISV